MKNQPNHARPFAMLSQAETFEKFKLIEEARRHLRELESAPKDCQLVTRLGVNWQNQADDAHDALILGNMGLVYKAASKYKHYCGLNYEEIDLVHWGVLGMHRAIAGFEWRRGNSFSTYAMLWIKQAMTRALSKCGVVRLPESQRAALSKVTSAGNELLQATGLKPSASDISRVTGMSIKKVHRLLELEHQFVVSLDAPLDESESGEESLHDVIGGDSPACLGKKLDAAWDHQVLGEALACLTNLERDVIELYFGIRKDEACTLAKVSDQYGVSPERIRQLKDRALVKLKKVFEAKEIKRSVKTIPAMVRRKPHAARSARLSAPVPTDLRHSQLTMRAVDKNVDHHLWRNGGYYWCNFIFKTANGKSRRCRKSLGTKDVFEARRRRDEMIRSYHADGYLAA